MRAGGGIAKTGIILANTGSPAAPTSEAVADYLRAFLSDPRICPTNPRLWNFVLNRFIIPKRAPVSAEKYASIWTEEGSPLTVGMQSLAKKLEDACRGDGRDLMVRCAASYAEPSLETTLGDCREGGCSKIIVIPLYPQSACSTTEVVKDGVARALASADWSPALTIVENYHEHPAYLDAIAQSVSQAGFGGEDGDGLLFAFHSVPMKDIRDGDAYGEQTAQTARAIAERLGLTRSNWAIGYQSRFDKSRAWLGPSTSKALESLSDAKRLFVVAPNFSIDCLETLYDIDVVMRREFESNARAGERSLCYVRCLNDSDGQVELMHDLVS